MAGPLSGVRVLDLTRVLAGPWASQMLADLGAEVLKIERPGAGDDTRAWGPPFLSDDKGQETRESAYYLSTNRNKRSLAIDITQAQGADLVRQLAAESDVVLENFKVGGLARYGLDYANLSALNPRLVYCSITGFGQTGPYRDRPGYDFMIQGMAGLMSVTGVADGEPGAGPQKVGVALSDVLTGLYAGIGVLGALYERERSGEGQYIDLALMDVQLACMANQAANYLVSGRAPERLGNAHPNIVPYQTFAGSEGHLIVAVGNDAQFARLCGVLGLPELASDTRFCRNALRVKNRDELIALLQQRFATAPSGEWLGQLEQAGVPSGPINSLAEVFDDPQVKARGMRIELAHASGASAPGVGNPVKFSRSSVEYRNAPPLLGQDTMEVLGRILGLDATQLQRLAGQGVIQGRGDE